MRQTKCQLSKEGDNGILTHVDSHMIVHPENDFGTTVEARLNVGVDCISRRNVNPDLNREDQKSSVFLPFSCSKQLLPKSMTLIALLAGCFRRMFCEVEDED